MGFGAVITQGSGFTPLDAAVMGRVVEVRVEQELSKPTAFAIRFEDDIADGDTIVGNRAELQSNQQIGIFVKSGEEYECLVHGPVTRVRSAAVVGGQGSWVEVHGFDKRIEMDRKGVQSTWTGRASDAATSVIGSYGLIPDCGQTTKLYSDQSNALAQRGTDLAFLEEIARRNNFELWLSYKVTPTPANFVVITTANLKKSPPQSAASLIPMPPILSAAGGKTINVQPPKDKPVHVSSFEAEVDYERPNAAHGFAQPESGSATKQTAPDPDPPMGSGRKGIKEVDNVTRDAIGPAVNDPDEQAAALEAEVTEAAWFVEADCSATLAQLGFVAVPHLVVDVAYAGARLSGPYQVVKALHVITATDHLIDFRIRANGLKPGGA